MLFIVVHIVQIYFDPFGTLALGPAAVTVGVFVLFRVITVI